MKTTTIVSKATLDDLKKELERRGIVKRVKYWEDKRGNKTDITQLSDEHLANIVNMLERRRALQDFYSSFADDCYEALSSIGDMQPMDM